MTQPHHDDGVVITGAFVIEPPLDDETRDLLDLVERQSFRAALGDRNSSLLDRLVPGHPDGPSPWVSCDEGCCLMLDECGLVMLDAIQPWLAYLVDTMLKRHRVSGDVLWWDVEGRDYFTLHISGRQVHRRRLLGKRGKRSESTAGPRALRSV